MGKLQFAPALARGWQIFTKDPLKLILGAIIAGLLSTTVVLFPVMIAGYVYMVSRIAMGHKAEMGDLFFGFNDFARYLVGGLICFLVILPALLLFGAAQPLGVVGAAIITGVLLPFWPLMVLKGLVGPDAFKESVEFYKREYLTGTIFGLLFLAAFFLIVIPFIGVVFLVAIPLCFAIALAAYEQSYGFDSEDEPHVVSGSN